jgi:hypothetical protein
MQWYAGTAFQMPTLGEELFWPEQQQGPVDCFVPQALSDLASDIMVDIVCAQTRPAPSRFRRAVETLAKSNLNPNAAVFTPKSTTTEVASVQPMETSTGTGTAPAVSEESGSDGKSTEVINAPPSCNGEAPTCSRVSPIGTSCEKVPNADVAQKSSAAQDVVAELPGQKCDRTLSAESAKGVQLQPSGLLDRR